MMVFTRDELQSEAAGLWRCMSLARAAAMLGVAPGSVARWRDGAALSDEMARRVAVSIVARDLDMVGVFGRVDTRGAHIEATTDSRGTVAVRVTDTNYDERGGA